MSDVTDTVDYDRLADQLDALNCWVWSEPSKPIIAGLDYKQCCKLSEHLHARRIRRDIEAFEDTTPAIRAYMLAHQDRYSQKPERVDLSAMAKAATTTKNQWGKTRTPYRPEPGCQLRMLLKQAVRASYSQQSYADYSIYLVPVTGEMPADLAICQRNLGNFVRYSDSHTGMAGSGCNYTAELVVNDHGALVVITCRASIAD